MPYQLYVLCEPPERDPTEAERYGGMSNDPGRRFRQHIHAAKTGKGDNPALRKWIRSLLDEGLLPLMKVFAFQGTRHAVRCMEAALIKKLRGQGFELLNTQHNRGPRFKRFAKGKKIPGRRLRDPKLKKKLNGKVVPR